MPFLVVWPMRCATGSPKQKLESPCWCVEGPKSEKRSFCNHLTRKTKATNRLVEKERHWNRLKIRDFHVPEPFSWARWLCSSEVTTCAATPCTAVDLGELLLPIQSFATVRDNEDIPTHQKSHNGMSMASWSTRLKDSSTILPNPPQNCNLVFVFLMKQKHQVLNFFQSTCCQPNHPAPAAQRPNLSPLRTKTSNLLLSWQKRPCGPWPFWPRKSARNVHVPSGFASWVGGLWFWKKRRTFPAMSWKSRNLQKKNLIVGKTNN